ncbi:MAG: sigma-70 family RNA polymerase sigma factor [Bradyrhizobiaceae bacterium]|nr:MAG: sigma-70 family RNA polymerase sigma factor [Bradyrhizobiaceae bacterium]
MPQPDQATQIFETQRQRLLRLAYRMLGSMSEAEDIVQDAWLRWQRADRSGVESPPAFLSRIVTRLCLDVMNSARARHESYFGVWLPEPIAGTSDEPDKDDLTLTLMMALERLSPLERATFLLHDVFGVPMDDIAASIERDPAAVRQLAARARKHVQDARPRFPVADDEGERIAAAFFNATRTGDVAALRGLLAQDVILQSDGGGKVIAFRNPIIGLARVLRLYRGLARKFGVQPPDSFRPARIDGLPGYVSRDRGDFIQTTALQIENGLITRVYVTRNPDKLRRVLKALNVPETDATQH